MDEPTTALDVVTQREILERARRAARAAGLRGAVHHPRPVAAGRDRGLDRGHVRGAAGGAGRRGRRCTGPRGTRTRSGCCARSRRCTAPRQPLTGIPGSPPDLRTLPPGCVVPPPLRATPWTLPDRDAGAAPARPRAAGARRPAGCTTGPRGPRRTGRPSPVRLPGAGRARTARPPGPDSRPRPGRSRDGRAGQRPGPRRRSQPAAASRSAERGGGQPGAPPSTGAPADSRPRRRRPSTVPWRARCLGGGQPPGAARGPGDHQALPGRPAPVPCTRWTTSRSRCPRAGSPRSSARAAPASRRWPGCSPGCSSRPRASCCSTASQRPSGRGGRRRYAQQVQLVLQDPFASLNPVHDVRYHLARPLKVHGLGPAGQPGRVAGRPAGAGRAHPARAVPAQVPARAVRRAAAAGGDRPGARGAAAGAARRRAGVDAGRVDPARRPQPARRPARAARAWRSSTSPTTSPRPGTWPTRSR